MDALVPYLVENALPALAAAADASNRRVPPLVAPVLVALSDLGNSLVLGSNEEILKIHSLGLLDKGVDDLLIGLVPVLDEQTERKGLLQVICSL